MITAPIQGVLDRTGQPWQRPRKPLRLPTPTEACAAAVSLWTTSILTGKHRGSQLYRLVDLLEILEEFGVTWDIPPDPARNALAAELLRTWEAARDLAKSVPVVVAYNKLAANIAAAGVAASSSASMSTSQVAPGGSELTQDAAKRSPTTFDAPKTADGPPGESSVEFLL